MLAAMRRRTVHRRAPGSIGLALAVASLSGCARPTASTIPRRIDGEVVEGAFVAPTTYQRFLEGELALARGDVEAARVALRAASPASDPVVLGRLAEADARAGDRAGAERRLDEAEARFPESEALAMARARIAEAAGDTDAAAAAYARAHALAPGSPEPVLAAVSLFEASGRDGDAVAMLAHFLGDSPERSPGAWWRYLRLLVEGRDAPASGAAIEDAAERLHRIAPGYVARVRELAARALAGGRAEAALHALRPLPRTPEDTPTFLRALAGVDGVAAALAALDRLADEAAGGPLGRGELLLELGRPAMAAAVAKAIVESQPEPAAYLLLGRAERARGIPAAALEALRRVPSGSDAYVPAQIEAARAHADAGQAARARRALADLAAEYGEDWPEIAEAEAAISGDEAARGRAGDPAAAQ